MPFSWRLARVPSLLAVAVQNTNNEGSVLAFSPFSKKKGKKYPEFY
jgi:hypothetical protein